MIRTPRARGGMLCAATALLVTTLVAAAGGPALAVPSPTTPGSVRTTPTGPADTPTLHTWDHADSVATSAPIADGQVRRSEFYDASVSTASDPDAAHTSFVYMSVPRSGEGKIGYDEQDGAEFSSAAGLTMSWSSFEYAEDVWVDVHLRTGQTISSADQVTIRPTDLGFEKELVDSSTIRVKVPYDPEGYRFSVEFDPQLYTAYNDMSGASGELTTVAEGNRAVHTEPQNSMLVFANPIDGAGDAAADVPSEEDGSIHYVEPGSVTDLDGITEDIVYFRPGTYYMGSTYHARLPENVRWVYIAPGAYVKGAFRFLHETQSDFKVTGLGVLSGEQYVYEPDTTNGYQHTTEDNCHSTCVKMLQFESSNTDQTLDLHGVTINQPPYHSFVVYAHEDGTEVDVTHFTMDVRNYKQVGSWYWQTDGIELYPDSTMRNTFFHANDDVLKLYHSNVTIDDTVIWKNENGPVVQWGWTPRNVHDVTVNATDVIHNRMYWKDVKYNTCVFNSSSHWEDMGATDRADTTSTVRDMRFTDTRVEGTVNCALRVFALSNTEDVEIDGFSVDGWNGLDATSQVSLLKRYHDRDGNQVTIGNEVSDGQGLSLHNYTVGGIPVLKAGDNWASDELGRLDFDADTWESWNATSDDQPTGAAPRLTVEGIEDGSTAPSRHITLSGTTDAPSVAVTVNGTRTEVPVTAGTFSTEIDLPAISNRITVTATADNGVQTVLRHTVTALGTQIGSMTDPVGDDNGPGSYTYPTDSAFTPGSFDLTGMSVYDDGDTVRFVTTTHGPITNPWGGNGMSTQRLNIYVRDGGSTTTTELLPGTNTSAQGAWTHAVVADGRYAGARFGGGVYGADLERIGDVALDVDPSGVIIASVPASLLEGVDLDTAGYQVSMYSDAEDGEGVGNVRPVYSAECAAGEGCPSFVGPYRVGGGAGEYTDDEESRDTDTRDSNALDIISGDVSQAEAMDWTSGAVVVPYVTLTADGQDTPGTDDGDDKDPGTGEDGTDDDGTSDGASGDDTTGDDGNGGSAAGDDAADGNSASASAPEGGLPVSGATLGGAFLVTALALAGAGAALRRSARSRR